MEFVVGMAQKVARMLLKAKNANPWTRNVRFGDSI